jgi:radical SAM superfamily enzyme YgiQ (UPF0313 family)
MGLLYSALEQNQQVRFLDAFAGNLSVEEVIERITSLIPAFVCINIFTTNYKLVKQIVEDTGLPVHWIIGGLSAKSLYPEIFKWETNNPIDVVYGDGERIVEHIIEGSVQELPSVEAPNRRYFMVSQLSAYYVRDISGERLNRTVFKMEPQTNYYSQQEVSIYTSRGCPYNCAYCLAAHSRNTELGPVRHKNKCSIIDELCSLKEMYPEVQSIRVLDDLFLSNRRQFETAMDIFHHFDYSWRAMCHIKSINSVSDELLTGLAKSRCRELFIGIESGAPAILKRIHKTDDPDLIIRSVQRVLDTGINVKGYFICGFPDETEEELSATLQLATRLTEYGRQGRGVFRNSTFQFRPYYGSELYNEMEKTGQLPAEGVLQATKLSGDLNKEIRNKSFNFDSGNYSAVCDRQLQRYVQKLHQLNDQPDQPHP